MKDLKTARKLVNNRINELLDRYAQNEHDSRIYLVRHCGSSEDMIEIQPTYNSVFIGIEPFVYIAVACDCSVYVDYQENKAGVITPTLHIF